MSLVYAQVARLSDGAVLAEHAAAPGNFAAVAAECLQRMAGARDERFTVAAEAYNFNFLLQGGYAFTVVAAEAAGRQLPFACASRISNAWTERFWESGRAAAAHAMDRSFGPILRREMDWVESHPAEVNRLAAVQSKVDEVKNIAILNVESAMARTENLDTLMGRTDDLRDQAEKFQGQGKQLRKRMCCQSIKARACAIAAAALLVLVIFLVACFATSTKCVSLPGINSKTGIVSSTAGPDLDTSDTKWNDTSAIPAENRHKRASDLANEGGYTEETVKGPTRPAADKTPGPLDNTDTDPTKDTPVEDAAAAAALAKVAAAEAAKKAAASDASTSETADSSAAAGKDTKSGAAATDAAAEQTDTATTSSEGPTTSESAAAAEFAKAIADAEAADAEAADVAKAAAAKATDESTAAEAPSSDVTDASASDTAATAAPAAAAAGKKKRADETADSAVPSRDTETSAAADTAPADSEAPAPAPAKSSSKAASKAPADAEAAAPSTDEPPLPVEEEVPSRNPAPAPAPAKAASPKAAAPVATEDAAPADETASAPAPARASTKPSSSDDKATGPKTDDSTPPDERLG